MERISDVLSEIRSKLLCLLYRFGFGDLKDREIGVSVLPSSQKIRIRRFRLSLPTLERVSTRQLKSRQGPERRTEHNAGVREAAHSKDASALLLHSGGSIAMNTQWLMAQHKLVAMGTQINLSTAAEIMKEIQQTNAQQDRWRKMMAGETDDFNDILNGRTFAVDSTGRTWDVPAGNGGQQWVNGQQTVVNSAFQPGPGFTALTPISR